MATLGTGKFRYIGWKAAAFVLISVALGAVGLGLAGRTQGWFAETLKIHTLLSSLPPDTTLSLNEGAEVQILGKPVGSVVEVSVSEMDAQDGINLRVDLRVRGKQFIALIRQDSQVLIRERLTGGTYLQITPGAGQPARDGMYLPGVLVPGLANRLGDLLRSLPLQAVVQDVKQITGQLAAGQGTLGRLLNDSTTAEEFSNTLISTRQTLDNTRRLLDLATQRLADMGPTLTDLRETSRAARDEIKHVGQLLNQVQRTFVHLDGVLEQMNDRVARLLKTTEALPNSLLKQFEELPTILLQTQQLMQQTTKLVEGLQKTWLLRDHIEPDDIKRLPATEVALPR